MGLEGPSSVDRSRGAGIQASMRPLTQLPLLSPCTEGTQERGQQVSEAQPLRLTLWGRIQAHPAGTSRADSARGSGCQRKWLLPTGCDTAPGPPGAAVSVTTPSQQAGGARSPLLSLYTQPSLSPWSSQEVKYQSCEYFSICGIFNPPVSVDDDVQVEW